MYVPPLLELPGLPAKSDRRIIDAHTHAWPERLHRAILDWFDRYSWPIIHRHDSEETPAVLEAQGLNAWVVMAYAHKPDISESLNRWLAEYARRHPKAVVLASVHPDDQNPREVLRRAIDEHGLKGIKLHNHVMGIAPEDPRCFPIYEFACERDLPLVLNAGREPDSHGYPVSTREVGGVDRIRTVLTHYPQMRCCVPHMAMDEWEQIPELFEICPGLMLDTTLCLASYFPKAPDVTWIDRYAERIMYGSDYPILPYPYDREWRCIESMAINAKKLDAIFYHNAKGFYKILEMP